MARSPNIPRKIATVGPLSKPCRVEVGAVIYTDDHINRDVISRVNILKNGALIELELCFADVCNLRSLLEDLQSAHADAESALEAADLEG
jgi:hypothetical protein